MKAKLALRVQAFRSSQGRAPRLDLVLVGDDPGSHIYTRNKAEKAREIGIESHIHRFPAVAPVDEVKGLVDRLNADSRVDGILIQSPLPRHFPSKDVLGWVQPEKDVDGFHPLNVGSLQLGLPALAPCTPSGVMALLEHYRIPVAGKTACVIGRSSIVGRPMAALLLQSDATVVQAHSRTPELGALTRIADIVVCAAGKTDLLGPADLKQGAVVVDVGIHRDPKGKVRGDAAFDAIVASGRASAITPVPGGVGPMTIAFLFENTMTAAERRLARV